MDPEERRAAATRLENNLHLTREIYKTDFRRGTYNPDMLPHVNEHVEAMMARLPALNARLERHIARDEVPQCPPSPP